MENNQILEHEVTMKYSGANDDEGIYQSARFWRISENPTVKFNLYDISPAMSPNTWKVAYYKVEGVIPTTPIIGQCKIKYKKITFTVPVSNGEHEKFFLDLIDRFKYGRVLTMYNYAKNKKIWSAAPGFFGRSIYYNQVKKILSFEHKAFVIPKLKTDHEKHAIRSESPRLIQERVDLGSYCIESWGRPGGRRNYSYIANSEQTKKWVDKICSQVSIR
jgi:hypothetical protein